MIQIQPVNYPLGKGTATKLQVIANSFDLLAPTISVQWLIFTNENEQLDSGYVILTEDEYQEWADDNNYVIDIVLDELGLIRA